MFYNSASKVFKWGVARSDSPALAYVTFIGVAFLNDSSYSFGQQSVRGVANASFGW